MDAQQTVETITQHAPPARVAVQPCAALAELARELAGTLEPTTIDPDDRAHMAQWAAMRCVVRWFDCVAVRLSMSDGRINAAPVWPDVQTVRGSGSKTAPPTVESARWSPLVVGIEPVSVSQGRPAPAQARDIVRRLVLPLTKAWPEIMRQHDEAEQYGRESLDAARTLQRLAHSRYAGFSAYWNRSGKHLSADIRSLTAEQAERLGEFLDTLSRGGK